jgi:hypothetical protein
MRLACWVCLLFPFTAAAQVQYNGANMNRPDNYREWIWLSSGFGMSYSAENANPQFDNVFVNPESYHAFLTTGTWPDKTVLVLEVRSSKQKESINQHGYFQGDSARVEVHVKDAERFPEKKWAFFVFGESAKSAAPAAANASCFTCHEKSGAVDSTFVQFYPILRNVAMQTPPKKLCEFPGFADPKLAEVTQATTAYYGCSAQTACLSSNLPKGEPVLVYTSEGDWTCGYHSDRNGAAPVWVRSQDIRSVAVETSPRLDAWAGTWGDGENHIEIQPSKSAGKLDLVGDAVWHGLGDNVHLGHFEGTTAPTGNHLHVSDDGCTVDLTLLGKYLVTDDNSGCGGINVHFAGLWRRAGKR